MKGIYTYIVSSVLLIISINTSQAATFLDLPDSTVSCMSAGTCTMDLIGLAPGYGGGVLNETAMYSKYDLISGTSSVLVGYSLYNAYEQNNDVTTPLGSYLWLEGATTYDLSSSQHDFTLYFDKVSPSPTSPSSSPDSATIGLTTTDLLNGGGFFSWYENTDGSISETSGDLILGNLDAGLCLALEGVCEGGVFFNLLYLNYFESGGTASLIPSLDGTDTRSSVFKIHRYNDVEDPYSNNFEQNFSVQPVPVPPAIWLFISGLAGLGLLRKRK